MSTSVTITTTSNVGGGNCLFLSVIQIVQELVRAGYEPMLNQKVTTLSADESGVIALRQLTFDRAQEADSSYNLFITDDEREGYEATLNELRVYGKWDKSYYAYGLVIDAIGFGIGELINVVSGPNEGTFAINTNPSPTGLYLVNIDNSHFVMGRAK